jgi:uncharacterized protein (DUF427 family)
MPRAIWKGTVIAEAPAEKCEIVENNVYFPPDAVKKEFFTDSGKHTVCPWKGTASYYNVEVDGEQNADAAWYYPTPKDAAKNIQNYVAFWRGVQVEK